MRWLLRPSTLLLISLVLAVAAGWVMLPAGGDSRPQPKAVGEDEEEVVWLYSATSASAWERFVSAVRMSVEQHSNIKDPHPVLVDYANAFPPQTTAVAELSLRFQYRPGRLVFRWYKLTSEWTVQEWIQALLARKKPPLAIIGGSSSDVALDMAAELNKQADRLGSRAPLLLITTATTVELNRAYPGRTFRFCMNNQRMAEAVTDFIWSQSDLRPDRAPVYVPMWDDDPYSEDLTRRFLGTLKGSPTRPALQGPLPTPQHIFSSVGSFERPNREEAATAEFIIDERLKNDKQQRPLLVLPAQTGPSRRFLRALVRTAPREARKFVVASGDALAFNTVYRDRNVTWPIQDLPFTLVLFYHRNPVDERAGFRPMDDRVLGSQDGSRGASGTEDILQFVDIFEAVVRAVGIRGDDRTSHSIDAGILRELLSGARYDETGVCFNNSSPLLFDTDGDRRPGTGEHIVCIRPRVEQGGRVLPEAEFSVWYWKPTGSEGGAWEKRREMPHVLYEGGPLAETGS